MGEYRLSRVVPALLVCFAGQHSHGFAKQYSFKSYGTADGLKNLSVTCLMEDHQGFLWVGTENGLFRYEGLEFTGFGVNQGLPDNTIQAIHETSDGRLWVATRRGVAVLEDERFVPDAVLGKVGVFGFGNIVSAADGALYVGTSMGLAKSWSRTGSRDRPFKFVTHAPVTAMAEDRSGNLLFASSSGLWKLSHGSTVSLTAALHLPPDQWNSLLVDRDRNLWIRSSRRLLFVKAGDDRFSAKPEAPHSNDVGTLYQTAESPVFLPTDHGLFAFSGEQRERIGAAQGLTVDSVSCVLQDHEGSLWVGLRGTGLVRWLGYGSWEGWKTPDGLTSDLIWHLARDADGTLWVATNDGLNALDPATGNFRAWPPKIDTRELNVRILLDDPREHALWFGAKPGGLYRLDYRKRRLTHFGAAQGLQNDQVNGLIWDPEGHLWVSTEAGLYRGTRVAGRMKFDRPDLPFTFDGEVFNGLLVDRTGTLWAAGSGGLLEKEKAGWRRYSKSDGLPVQEVSQIAETPDGSIWIAYLSNSGVSRLRHSRGRPSIENFTTANGLSSNGAVGLAVDSRQWLWVASDNGLDVYSPSGWKHYGQVDGLIWNDVDAPAMLAESDGSVWVGTSLGLSRFRPPAVNHPDRPPAPFILSAHTENRKVDSGRFMPANQTDRSITFRFASNTHLNESAVRFKYRLAGLESDWTETAEHAVTFSNLEPGSYTFEVLARSAAGLWSSAPARRSFQIFYPWWRVPAVELYCTVLLLAALFVLWRFRIRYLVKRQAHLEELLLQAQLADRFKTETLAHTVKAEALQRSRGKVLELVGSRADLEATLEALIDVLEVDQPKIICSIFRVIGARMRLVASRRLGELFREQYGEIPIACGEACLTAAATGGEVSEHVDLQNCAHGAFAAVARDLSLSSCRSSPIFSGAGAVVLGTLTIYRSDSDSGEGPLDLRLIEEAVRLAGIAMENLELYRQLSHGAQFDALTDLPNRTLFHERLEQAPERANRSGTKFAVAWLDLDGFKHINDSLGHQAGDVLLQRVARNLSGCLRPIDTLARVGGDEFTLILADIRSRDQIAVVLNKVRAALAAPVEIAGAPISVSASIGVSVYPDDGRDTGKLVKSADIAMYHAKRVGKNELVYFSEELSNSEADRVALEGHLRQALARQELDLRYQPQFKPDGSLECVEALVRWDSPVLGNILPSRFIPVAESTGLIIQLGQFVLRQATRQAVAWLEAGIPKFRIAVNVSAAQFARADFCESVSEILKQSGLPAAHLELELTETALMSNLKKSAAHLRAIRDLGARVAIDDFGAGYSSLNYLQHLSVNTLKIDRSFVQNLDRDQASRTMFQAIVNLAHQLNLEVVAEGVENEAQLACVWAMGCDLVQGFYLARPVSAEHNVPLMNLQRTLGTRAAGEIFASA